MNTLFNALKGINKFGLALVLGALILVVTQSAFKQKQTTAQLYYFDSSAVPAVWVKAGSIHLDQFPDDNGDYEPNSYRCEDNIEQKCTAMFDETDPTLPESAIPNSGTLTNGDFVLNP